MDLLLVTVIGLVILALVFDFTNGFHDAANSVATVVATKALPAKWAPAFSAAFNFLAFFVVGTGVANTIAKTVKPGTEGPTLIFAALFAAIVWNFVTWRFGMPSSSSHAIIGGLVGAGLAAGGTDAITWSSVEKAVIGIFASPVVAFTIAFAAMYLVLGIQWIFKLRDNHPVFKGAQLVSAAAVSFGHGANDAQKTMGVIAALLVGAGYLDASGDSIAVPDWVALCAYGSIAAGTLWGGWKIIETLGLRLTTLHASSGTAANIGATTAIFGATAVGMPISTTHAAASSIIGAGVGSGKGANWRVVGEMVIAWVVTLPSAALVSFVMFRLTTLPLFFAWVAVGVVVIAFIAWAVNAMRHTVHADDIAAEIPADTELATHVEGHPHLEGHAPVETDPITEVL